MHVAKGNRTRPGRVPFTLKLLKTNTCRRPSACCRKQVNESLHQPLAAARNVRAILRSHGFLEGLKGPVERRRVPQSTSPVWESKFRMSGGQHDVMSLIQEGMSCGNGHQATSYHNNHDSNSTESASTGQLGRQ